MIAFESATHTQEPVAEKGLLIAENIEAQVVIVERFCMFDSCGFFREFMWI